VSLVFFKGILAKKAVKEDEETSGIKKPVTLNLSADSRQRKTKTRNNMKSTKKNK
jgi:hypothetical protein